MYAVYVSPLFDLTTFHAFADDNQIIETNENLARLVDDMRMKIEMMTKWLKDSGLTVNESKTELCLYHKNDHQLIEMTANNVRIRSKPAMNILRVLFDSKLQWAAQAGQAISTAKRALQGIRLIKNYFNRTKLIQLLTSNYYSIPY